VLPRTAFETHHGPSSRLKGGGAATPTRAPREGTAVPRTLRPARTLKEGACFDLSLAGAGGLPSQGRKILRFSPIFGPDRDVGSVAADREKRTPLTQFPKNVSSCVFLFESPDSKGCYTDGRGGGDHLPVRTLFSVLAKEHPTGAVGKPLRSPVFSFSFLQFGQPSILAKD